MKKVMVYLSLLAWLSCVTTGCSSQSQPSINGDTVIATVNDEPIAYGEYARIAGQSAAVSSQPMKLNEDAVKKVIRTKLEQIWAQQEGVIAKITYLELIAQWKQENKRRKLAVAKKQVIYGPVQYDEFGYMDYVHTNMVHQLKEKLGQEEFLATDRQLLSLYDEIKDQYYKKTDVITTQIVKLNQSDDDAAKAKMQVVKTKLDAGSSPKQAVSLLEGNGSLSVQVFDGASTRLQAEVTLKLFAVASRLHAGQISEVIEENQQLFILMFKDRKDEGYQSLAEVKQHVMSVWVNRKYEEKLNERIQQARVEIQDNHQF
jgi:hypothetical protein